MRTAKYGFAICLALLGLSNNSVKGQEKMPVPRWQSDKKLAAKLAPIVKIDAYSLRPPDSYQMQPPPEGAPAGTKMFAWAGTARKDNTHPTLMLLFFVPPKGEAEKYTLEELTNKMLGGVKRQREDWQQGKTEKGLINGVVFARIRWTGTEPTQNRKMQGFIYVARVGDTIIELNSQDVLPEAAQALPLAEAAALTFKKN